MFRQRVKTVTHVVELPNFVQDRIRMHGVRGGSEEVVVNTNENPANVSFTWYWRVTSEGIFFVDNSAKPTALLKLFSFGTRTVRTVRQLHKQAWGGPGLAVSPDGRTVLIGQIDDSGSDIMLVENFH
jgi:hypothetical protein